MNTQEPRLSNNTGLMIAVGIVGLLIGYIIGVSTSSSTTGQAISSSTEEMADTATAAVTADANQQPATTANSALVTGNPSDVAFTIDATNLSAGQRTALSAAGISEDSIVITNGMVVCMEAEIGADRMMDIQNGGSPSISEGIALASCYSAN